MDTDSGSDDTGEHKADAESDTKTLEELYKLSSEGRLETKTPKCILLPTYDAEVGGTIRKMLIDTGASTVYYASKSLANELGFKTIRIKVAGRR